MGDDMQTCLHGLFCPSCRTADTWGTARVIDYWLVILVFICTPFLSQMCSGILVAIVKAIDSPFFTQLARPIIQFVPMLVSGAVYGHFRQHLREKLGANKEGKSVTDWLTFAFCSCCAVVQEARTVDAINGVSVSCCCQIQYTSNAPMVGQPI